MVRESSLPERRIGSITHQEFRARHVHLIAGSGLRVHLPGDAKGNHALLDVLFSDHSGDFVPYQRVAALRRRADFRFWALDRVHKGTCSCLASRKSTTNGVKPDSGVKVIITRPPVVMVRMRASS